VESRRTLWTRIRSFVARGGSVLLTTHYLEEADALAHRVAVIDRGRIAAEGTPAQIKAQTHTTGLEDAFLAIMKENGNAVEEMVQ
jgi:ABC-2 type transport system ATP-binding protein